MVHGLYITQLIHVRGCIHGLSSAEGFKREHPPENHPFFLTLSMGVETIVQVTQSAC